MSADITEERIAEIESALDSGENLDPSLVVTLLGHVKRLRSQLAAKEKEAEYLRGIMHGQETECRAREEQDRVYRTQITALESQLAALQAVPQGVEVPELTEDDVRGAIIGTNRWREATAKLNALIRARLVPTPPQAAPGAVALPDFTNGHVIREAVKLGMQIGKGVPHPLQPEERRVGADEVVVGREEWERLKRNHLRRMIDSCPEAETRAWQTFRASDRNLRLGAATPRAEQITKRLGRFVAKCDDALRTSAQDHNGEGAK